MNKRAYMQIKKDVLALCLNIYSMADGETIRNIKGELESCHPILFNSYY